MITVVESTAVRLPGLSSITDKSFDVLLHCECKGLTVTRAEFEFTPEPGDEITPDLVVFCKWCGQTSHFKARLASQWASDAQVNTAEWMGWSSVIA